MHFAYGIQASVKILSSNRQHVSSDNCPDDNREDYQNCFVLLCVRQYCTMLYKQVQAIIIITAGLGLHPTERCGYTVEL